jgi:hypothetical protein
MAQLFALVPAPVLGPACWAPVAGELARSGHDVAVLSVDLGADRGPPYARRLVQRASTQVPAGPADRVILVLHSGAGVFAPLLAEAIAAGDTVAVFADAAIPPRSGGDRVVDSRFLPYLRDIATGGVVPPWPQWWPADEMAPLFPDEASRLAVSSEARPLPLAFFEEDLPPAPDSWRACHPAYLRFSEAYQEPADEAARRGWPMRELAGEHLHMVVDPPGVAAAITALAADAAGQASQA